MLEIGELELDVIGKVFSDAKTAPGPLVTRLVGLAKSYHAAFDDDAAEDECAAEVDAEDIICEFDEVSETLADSRTELRPWELSEDGSWYDTVLATSPKAALNIAESNIDKSIANTDNTTVWFELRVRCLLTGDDTCRTVRVDPEAPDCAENEHDWRTPAFCACTGHGGGVISKTVCANCGIYEGLDTWAQNRETGEQGLNSLAYHDADAASLAYVLQTKLFALRDAHLYKSAPVQPSSWREYEAAVLKVTGVDVCETHENLTAVNVKGPLTDIDDVNNIVFAVDELLNPSEDED